MAEYFDVLDEQGRPTGVTKKKVEVHTDGDWHKAVKGWIIDSKGRVLMQKRSEREETHPGTLDISFAGHVSAGESSQEAVIREAQEELGILLKPEDTEYLFTASRSLVHNNGKYLDNELFDLYLIRMDVDTASIVYGSDVDGVELLHYKEIEKRVKDHDPKIGVHPESYDKMFRILDERFSESV